MKKLAIDLAKDCLYLYMCWIVGRLEARKLELQSEINYIDNTIKFVESNLPQ